MVAHHRATRHWGLKPFFPPNENLFGFSPIFHNLWTVCHLNFLNMYHVHHAIYTVLLLLQYKMYRHAGRRNILVITSNTASGLPASIPTSTSCSCWFISNVRNWQKTLQIYFCVINSSQTSQQVIQAVIRTKIKEIFWWVNNIFIASVIIVCVCVCSITCVLLVYCK